MRHQILAIWGSARTPENRNQTIKRERERDSTNAVPPHLRRDVFRYPGDMASTRGGLISVWPCASEESESTLREADVLATLPMYDPGLLASWYRRRDGSALCRWDDLGRRQNLQLC